MPAENTSCLSLFVAVLNDNVKAEKRADEFSEELRKDESYYSIEEYVYLDPVTKLTTSTNPIYDEGDIRLLYIDYTVSVDFIVTNSSNMGSYVDGSLDPKSINRNTFNERLARLEQLLRTQRLGINFGNFPSPIRKLAPGDEQNVEPPIIDTGTIIPYSGYSGWLIDNHNGPKTLSLEFTHMAGSDAVMVNWQFKARVSNTHREAFGPDDQYFVIPKISQELRLDVDKEGDLEILLSGTVYADTLAALYRARDYLHLNYIPASVNEVRLEEHGEVSIGRWAMINGFTKEASFNVEKNGRSAQFRIKYSQVKSNNAYPQGIRDIKFEQTVESDLMTGGFRKWMMGFKGEIKIPSRMNALYAWYIFHLLVQQQTRRTTMKMDSISNDASSLSLTNKMTKDKTPITAFPVRIKIFHSHFSRTLKFEMDYWLLCPLQQLATASCIFDRINNDYQLKLDRDKQLAKGEQNDYVPRALSVQWYSWTQTVDPTYGFDPELGQNRYATLRPNRDTAGTEIVDTGHNYNAYKPDYLQRKQNTTLITSIVDPNDKDANYAGAGPNIIKAKDNVRFKMNVPSWYKPKEEVNKTPNYNSGTKQEPPLEEPTISRSVPEIDPEVSWMKYEQTYEIVETHQTLPVESLSEISINHYNGVTTNVADQTLDDLTVGIDEENISANSLDPKFLAQQVGTYFHGRASTIEPTEEPLSPGDPGYVEGAPLISKYKRKTYAVKPSRFYVTVRGQAIRAQYKIPIPVVIEIAGQKAIKVGTGKSRHKTIIGDSEIPVYLATWEQTYTIDETIECADILASIKDTGTVALYI